MIDRCLNAYNAVLMSLPEQQRHAFQLLMNAHGLHPDDPSIVAVTLNFMVNQQQKEQSSTLASEAISAIAEFKRIQKLPRVQDLVAVMMSFRAGTREASILGAVIAFVILLFSGFTALKVHEYDNGMLHTRVCAVETLYLGRLGLDAERAGRVGFRRWINSEVNPECSAST